MKSRLRENTVNMRTLKSFNRNHLTLKSFNRNHLWGQKQMNTASVI